MNLRLDPFTSGRPKAVLGLWTWFAVINAFRPLYETALARYHGDRIMPWTINGVPFRIHPHYRQLMGQEWDAEVADFLSESVQPGALCLDVGANAGIYVLQFCH